MENEKRKAIRIEKAIAVQYKDALYKDNTWDMTFVKDISEGGMHITTSRYYPHNSILIFRLELPSRPFLCLEPKGRVVECEKSGSVEGTYMTRIEFADLDEDTRRLIREYIDWFLRKKEEKK